MIKNQRTNLKKQDGAVLLLALVILGIIVVIVGTVSVLSLREKKLSANTENALRAYYAASSGMEINLEKYKTNPAEVFTPGYEDSEEGPMNQTSWQVAVETQGLAGVEVMRDQSLQYNFVGRSVGLTELHIDRTDLGSASLEYKLSRWPKGDFALADSYIIEGLCDISCQQNNIAASGHYLTISLDENAYDYILRIKPLLDDATLAISANPEENVPASDLLMIATGNYDEQNKKAIQVALTNEKIKGIFDYVLFADVYSP